MDKLAQQEISPLLTTPIDAEPLVKGVWNKYFAQPHAKIVRMLRSNMQHDPGLQTALTTVFPGYSWPEFADMPSKATLMSIKDSLSRIMALPQTKEAAGVEHAIASFMEQYNQMVDQLQQQPSKEAPKAKKPAQSGKVKELQQLLGIEQSGLWNTQTNNAFLSWLKANGWDKYISNNRFTGNINDALTAILTEKASPDKPMPATEEVSPSQRQAARLEALKKLG